MTNIHQGEGHTAVEMLQLKIFVSLARTCNFTKTAKEFYMSQPTVSNHMKTLERSLGVRLFDRDSHKVSLTQEGQELVDYANNILTLKREAEVRLLNISKGRRGYIRIALLSSMMAFFSECLSVFSKEYPEVQVDVFRMEGIEMMRAFRQKEYDVYFTHYFMAPFNKVEEYILTGAEQLRLYYHKRDAGKFDVDDFTSMQNLRFVAVSEMDFASSGQIKNVCAKRGLTPENINYYNNAETVLLAVNSGVGMAILPYGVSHFFNFTNVESVPIAGDDATVKYIVAWHKAKRNIDVQNFLNISPIKELM